VSIDTILESASPELRSTVTRLREVVRDTLPAASEEVDATAQLIGFTYKPGTYKHLVGAIAIHKGHANLMLSSGAQLLDVDQYGLLEGTGSKARHIVMRSPSDVDRPGVTALLLAADERTPRPA